MITPVVLALLIHKAKKLSRARFDWYFSQKQRMRRNIITYYVQLLVTTVVLLVFLIKGAPLLVLDARSPLGPHSRDVELVLFFGSWVCTLYLWEFAYKLVINWQLVLHHVATIVLIGISASSFYDTHCWAPVFGFIMFGFTAVTEQSTFVALLLYRMERWRLASRVFYGSAVWNALLKTFIVVASGFLWRSSVVDIHTDPQFADVSMWLYIFWPLVAVLYFSQIYASFILFKLARSSANKARMKDAGELQFDATGKRDGVVRAPEANAQPPKAAAAWHGGVADVETLDEATSVEDGAARRAKHA